MPGAVAGLLGRLRGARALHHPGAHLPHQGLRRPPSLWPGDGQNRSRPGHWIRLLGPLSRAHWPDRMGGTALPPDIRRRLQAFRGFHGAICMGDFHHQQPLFSSYRPHCLGDRGALFQPECGPVVGLDLGTLSCRDAICRPLGLGDVADHVPVVLCVGGSTAHAPIEP